jgi:hypothetical protein
VKTRSHHAGQGLPSPVPSVAVDDLDRDDHLAPAYQLALELEAAGLEGRELAARLGVPAEALPSLLSLAHAKADNARNRRPRPGEPGPDENA